jgi:hypothetical protein
VFPKHEPRRTLGTLPVTSSHRARRRSERGSHDPKQPLHPGPSSPLSVTGIAALTSGAGFLVVGALLLETSGAVAAPPSPSGGGPPVDPLAQHCSRREMCPDGIVCTTGLAGTEPAHSHTDCARRGFARGLVRRCSHNDGSILLLCPPGQAGDWPGSSALAAAELTPRATTEPAAGPPPAPPARPIPSDKR